ncbi:MAG: hypothetical protein IAE95_02000, partial [Chitinophagaceae bacterium]|nr:hypothetical protein [Chitinophagaceae bacterium]
MDNYVNTLKINALQNLAQLTFFQFAQLPAAAVWQRFGAAGKLAQQWARGKDERPVCGAVAQPQPPVTVILDPPATQVDMAVADVMASLHPLLAGMAERMEGVLRLHL